MVSPLVLAALMMQAAAVQPAGDSVEVEIAVTGTAEVPAQGYRLNAFLSRRQAGSPEPVDTSSLVKELEALEMPERETCMPFNPYGFAGNELMDFGDEEEFAGADDDALAGAPEAVRVAEASRRARSPVPYAGLFACKTEVERAQALIEGRQQRPAILQGVLFDCSEAFDQARLAALSASAQQVEPLARALGMRVGGITRVASAPEDQGVLLISAMFQFQTEPRDTVKVQSALRVTYRLER